MKFIFFLLIIGFLLYPIAKLRPSAQQKRDTKMRSHAVQHGLQIQFAKSPNPQMSTENKPCIRYQIHHKPEKMKRFSKIPHSLQWIRIPNGEEWELLQRKETNHHQAITAKISHSLKQLPESVHAFEVNRDHVACYWFEEGDEHDISQIALSLNQLESQFDDMLSQYF